MKMSTFLPGALVRLSVPTAAPGLSLKLLPKYEGPYRVVECASPVNYVIEPVDPSLNMCHRGRDIVNVERLKPHYDPLIVMNC